MEMVRLLPVLLAMYISTTPICSTNVQLPFQNWAQSNLTHDREVEIFKLLQEEWKIQDWPSMNNETLNTFTLSQCDWNGVICDKHGRAVKLHLNSKNIDGTIPSVIGELSMLEQLYLYGNRLTGSIPIQLANLSRLTHFSVGDNRLEGTIPSELGQLTSLQYFFLFGNKLEGTIPKSLGNMQNLLHLGLWNNELSGSIPADIGNLSKLQYLGLNGNRLDGALPPLFFSSLTQLSFLYLAGNAGLEGTLPDVANLASLEGLYLSNTNISGKLPCQLAKLPKLKSLEASDTRLSGCLTLECLAVAPDCAEQLGAVAASDVGTMEVGVEL